MNNTQSDNSVFSIKKKKLNKKEIFSSIPKDALKEKNIELEKTHTEIRWRIYKIPYISNIVIDISFKNLYGDRYYMMSNGEWQKYDLNSNYDKYIIDEFYYYQK